MCGTDVGYDAPRRLPTRTGRSSPLFAHARAMRCPVLRYCQLCYQRGGNFEQMTEEELAEIRQEAEKEFESSDKDKDGKLTLEEGAGISRVGVRRVAVCDKADACAEGLCEPEERARAKSRAIFRICPLPLSPRLSHASSSALLPPPSSPSSLLSLLPPLPPPLLLLLGPTNLSRGSRKGSRRA
eukprot:3942005-Rhodomonas_salina.1